jgi:tyrosine-specific transport protein
MFKKPSVLSGALLVAGTSIGAGMLALPVVTALGGFFPSLLVYVLCWLFMTCTGLLMLEICLKMPPDANLVSMSEKYLGKAGKVGAWVLYLFLFYCLSVAYVCGGGSLLSSWLMTPGWVGSLLFVLTLSPFVYVGASMVDRLNKMLMLGLIGAYLAFVLLGVKYVDLSRLTVGSWKPALLALPVIFTSFSYQGVIPSLATYMQRDAKRLKAAIILGTSFSFVIYLVWEFLILGIIPVEGALGLERARELGQTAVHPLGNHVASGFIPIVGQMFAFFAITTSYLGVTLGLFDFLADGLKKAKMGLQRLGLALLTFLPPLIIGLLYPGIFISALIYAGGLGCALLLGLFPTLMVWVARARKEEGPSMLGGGRAFLSLLMAFVVLEIAIEFLFA